MLFLSIPFFPFSNYAPNLLYSILEVRKALEIQLNNSGNILEETLVGIYEENSKLIQDKLQEIFSTLDRICRYLNHH